MGDGCWVLGVGWAEQHLACKFPDNDAGGYRYIERVFGAKLGNFEATVAHINHFLMNTFHLVAQNDGHAGTLGSRERIL